MKKTQKLHFPFCSELKNNVSLICPDSQKRSNWSVPFPKLALFKINTNFASNFWSSFGGSNYVELEGIKFIDDLVIEEVSTNSFSDIMQGSYFAFIAPHDFLSASNKKKNTRCYYYDQIKGKITFAENEGQKWFKEQSHLAEHSTFQLFFLDGMLGTYNLGKMDYEIQEGKVIINYVLTTKATPSGTLFRFQSGEISPPIRWELAIKGNVITMKVFQEIYKGQEGLWKKIKSPLLKIGGGIAGGLVGGPAGATAGTAAGSALAKDDKKSDNVEQNKGIEEALGLVNVKGSKATEEQQTKRWLEAIDRTGEHISDPTLYYTNDIGFSYNFFDFWMRLNEWDRILTSRLVFSSDLYNNLIHNNNENPITYPLNITFKKLGNILRPGYWQGKLTLDYDPGGKMAECFRKGVFFYEDKEKDFPNPNLGVSQQSSTSLYSLGGFGDVYTAQALTEPDDDYVVPVNRPKGSNFHQRGHYFIFYEDGSTDHWLALYPDYSYGSGFNNELKDGHTHGAFILNFDKPVKKMVDIYTCVGCGAHSGHRGFGQTTPGFLDLHPSYDTGRNFETIHKGLPVEPWYSKLVSASLNSNNRWITADGDRCLGTKGDVWEKATQEIPGKTFTKAYGFIASDNMITWRLSSQTSKIKLQKVPQHDDFDKMDWTPPAGGGDIEIPLMEPDIPEPEPGADSMPPEPDFVPDLDISGGGEPEITIEPDITQEPDITTEPDIPEPEVPEPEITPPDTEPDPTKDPEPDKPEKDPNDPEPEKPEDFD